MALTTITTATTIIGTKTSEMLMEDDTIFSYYGHCHNSKITAWCTSTLNGNILPHGFLAFDKCICNTYGCVL